ncbi:GntR family transcriptional regulator [Azospirillum sp. TSO22-1]|uniref:GntR family transcriptional regulator n=1 Tax=Azospirillum sp. TSO22-1 TaxID=716789 RepID=UPI000D608222|nr:GntR family transcriptional regulator [Azospirillum sp. TSO22-1]PWC41739.1 GntR family transcriptional regulator [Azospirillum sp. TSO22-1]
MVSVGSGAIRRRAPRPGRAGRGRGSTAAQEIYQHLRAEIMTLRRKPGEPISENELAVAYGVSRTPVREAVRQLSAEGLLEVFPQAGTFIARIPLASLPEAMVVRAALEETTARHAARTATPEQIRRLDAILDRHRTAAAAEDREAFHQADEDFHEAIAAVAGLSGVWALVQQVKVQIDRYRRLTLPGPGRMVRVIDEHAAIAAAIARHDPEAAAGAIHTHLGKLADEIIAFSKSMPDYFLPGE